jgi:hypothetical protein
MAKHACVAVICSVLIMLFLYLVLAIINSYCKQIQSVYIQHNILVRSCYPCCSENVIGITFSECLFVVLGVQHAIPLCHVKLSPMVCPAVTYFSISHKRHDFLKKKLKTKCVLILSTNFV